MSSYHSLISFSSLGTTVYPKINLYERSLNLSEPPLFYYIKFWVIIWQIPITEFSALMRKKHKQLIEVLEFLKKLLNKHLWCICPSS